MLFLLFRRKKFTLFAKTNNNTNQNEEKISMDSVEHVNILDGKMIINCKNYFPNATELVIDCDPDDKNEKFFFNKLTNILSLNQLTQITIDAINNTISEMIKLLRLTPNLHTLTIQQYDCDLTDLVTAQQSESFQLISKINNITTMTVITEDTAALTKFMIALFPQVECLIIKHIRDDSTEDLRFLLTKDNINADHLKLLCFKTSIRGSNENIRDFY